jgi:putative flippase GtrA
MTSMLVLRHQIAAAIATGADFTVMVLLAELARVASPIAAVLSALVGGAVNLTLTRRWAFRGRHDGSLGSQVVRYAIVSSGAALLNGALLAVALHLVDVWYPIARAVVAFTIGVLYTFPLHARFVFRIVPRPEIEGTA